MTKEKILKEIQSYAKDKEALQRNVKDTYGYIPFDLLSTKQKSNKYNQHRRCCSAPLSRYSRRSYKR
jgi:hypothetical protein